MLTIPVLGALAESQDDGETGAPAELHVMTCACAVLVTSLLPSICPTFAAYTALGSWILYR